MKRPPCSPPRPSPWRGRAPCRPCERDCVRRMHAWIGWAETSLSLPAPALHARPPVPPRGKANHHSGRKKASQQARPEIGGPRAEQRREVGAPGRPALLDTPHGEVLRARRAPRFSPTSHPHRRSQIPANTTTSDTDHTVRQSELVISSAAASSRIGLLHQNSPPSLSNWPPLQRLPRPVPPLPTACRFCRAYLPPYCVLRKEEGNPQAHP